jgi:Outer membrane protein beta-barrel domain
MIIGRHLRLNFLILFVFSSIIINAQQLLSVDVASNTNLRNSSPGVTLGVFYHLSDRISGGLEINRFFKHHKIMHEESEMVISAWDFDLNIHYNISASKKLFFYPLVGVSHTSEREMNINEEKVEMKHFYSRNAGAGLFLGLKNFAPFIEYMHTWGKINQEFFLVGVGYEFHLGHKQKH